jgi:hypothetical protein
VEQVKQNDNRDRNPEQPKQNASTHSDLLADDKKLFPAGDLANGVLGLADSALNPAFGLIGLAFSFSAGIAKNFAGLFFHLPSGFFYASCDTIFIHCQSLWLIIPSGNTVIRQVVPHRRKRASKQKRPRGLGGVSPLKIELY